MALQEIAVMVARTPLSAPPGLQWKYSSPAFDTLGRVIEVASGQLFEAFMKERVFTPLAMKDSCYF